MRSSTSSHRATSPGTTSSTTSRCTGSPAPPRRQPGRTGRTHERWPQRLRAASLLRRSPCRSPSRRSPARSGPPREAGSRRSTRTSPTSTRPTRAATSRRGRSRSSSRKSSEPRSDRCAEEGAMSMTEIRPFRVDVPQEALDDLRRRIASTRWPSSELVNDRSQGVQLATMQELARYWTTDYDWRKNEARLNALPQFKTEIDGLNIHFIHVQSAHADALPLIMTHGWPGSIVELLETIGPLTDPTAHGGRADDAFHLVLPSIPGYGFSGEPAEVGWDLVRTAGAWAELM